MRFGKSIAGSFILIVLFVLLIGQGSLWIWFLYDQKGHNTRMLSDKISSIGSLAASFSSAAMTDYNYEPLDRFLDVSVRDGDIISVRVLDARGNVLMERTSSRSVQAGQSANPLFMPWTNKLAVPVRSGSETIGTVEITYSGDKVNAAMLSLLTVPPAGQALVVILMISVIYLFFQRSVGSPVKTLQNNIENVTAGDLTVDISDAGENELGVISNGLRFLVKGLSSTVTKLHLTTNNVAMAIKQLNLTFGNMTKGIQKQSNSVDKMFLSLKNANESQKMITNGAERLSEFSAENVTSLLQMKTIADEIASSTNRLFQASENSYSTVAELSQTSKAMAENAEKMLTSVEDALASVEEISASVKEVESSAKESTSLADNVREVAAEKGVITVSEAIEGMERISDKVRYSVEIVRRLGARSKDIEKMLSVIKEVTEQTNLLSLNAAILAAQAGEYGKGFSVVSDEIRALSDRTAASTKEITGIVSTIQSEIADAVVSIEAGMQFVDDGSSLVYKAGEAMGSILDASRKSVQMAKAIEKATEEQAGGLRQISTSIDDIRKMVSRMTKATNEQSKASEFMLERVGEVREVAESTKRGTEEQAVGTKLISKNLELAGERLAEINQSVLNQEKINEGIISYIEEVKGIGAATLRDMEAVSLSLRSLEGEMNMLRKEMEAFKVG